MPGIISLRVSRFYGALDAARRDMAGRRVASERTRQCATPRRAAATAKRRRACILCIHLQIIESLTGSNLSNGTVSDTAGELRAGTHVTYPSVPVQNIQYYKYIAQ